MPFFYKPKVGLHHSLNRAAMSIFGTNRPLHLEKTIDQHSLKNLYGIWGKQNLPQKTKKPFHHSSGRLVGTWSPQKTKSTKLIFSNCNNNIGYMFIIKFLVDLQNQCWRITLGSTYSETLNVSFSLFVPALEKSFYQSANFASTIFFGFFASSTGQETWLPSCSWSSKSQVRAPRRQCWQNSVKFLTFRRSDLEAI